ncbi:MAG: hypothetical protein WBG10_08430 [Pseudolabrys sp.]
MRQRVLSVAMLAVFIAPAYADDGCDKFGWSVARERALFTATNKADITANTTLESFPSGAFVLHLQPDSKTTFAMPPERKSKAEHWFGGMVRLPAIAMPGLYQVTLSDEAWIDVVQDGRYARSIGSAGRSDCPGLRKSVRFELNAAPFILQLSGVTSETIVVMVSRND